MKILIVSDEKYVVAMIIKMEKKLERIVEDDVVRVPYLTPVPTNKKMVMKQISIVGEVVTLAKKERIVPMMTTVKAWCVK